MVRRKGKFDLRMRELGLWVTVYLLSGAAQPLLTDTIKYHGGVRGGEDEWPPTLLPLLASAVGMAMVGQLHRGMQYIKEIYNLFATQEIRSNDANDYSHFQPAAPTLLAYATLIDLSSGILVVSGLIMVGSGVYTVIYSSTTAWTALLSWLFGGSLKSGQWVGIAFVSLGLVMNALGVLDDSSRDSPERRGNLLLGIVILLLGTILHAGAFVFNEKVIKTANVSPFALCTQIGTIEAMVVAIYNGLLVLWYDVDVLYLDAIQEAQSTVGHVLFAYMLLVFTNAMHALAFFAMLGQLGAVATGVLKAVLAVSVFSFAALFFCSYEMSQCFTAFKAASMLIVLFGSFVFVFSAQQGKSVVRKKSMV